MQKVKNYFKELNEKFTDYQDVKEGLRTLHSNGIISNSEYDYVLENWDDLLVELGFIEQEMLDIMKR